MANATELVRDVARPDLLLVGALLHDIGKGYPGDHSVVGMDLAERILPRMGFNEEDTDIVLSLVEHHLLLPETATRRDLADPRTAANVADAVQDPLRLELMRALVEADSLATGPSAWSSWKELLLDELVDAVNHRFRDEAPKDVPLSDARRRYGALVDLVRVDGRLHLEHEQVGELDRAARGHHRPAGPVLPGRRDVGDARHRDHRRGRVDQPRRHRRRGVRHRAAHDGRRRTSRKIHNDLLDVLSGRIDVEGRIEARVRTYQRAYRRAQAASPPRLEVLISNEASDSTTMIDVRAPDAPAVLYRLSSALAHWGVDIRSAKVATLGHEVVDVFYVQPADGAGQLDASDHEDLREHVKNALAPA